MALAGDIIKDLKDAAVGGLHQRIINEGFAGFDEERLAI